MSGFGFFEGSLFFLASWLPNSPLFFAPLRESIPDLHSLRSARLFGNPKYLDPFAEGGAGDA